jgi:hypothetical protein
MLFMQKTNEQLFAFLSVFNLCVLCIKKTLNRKARKGKSRKARKGLRAFPVYSKGRCFSMSASMTCAFGVVP